MPLMTLDDLQQGIKSMPPLPAVVLELTQMINTGDINLNKIEQKLSEDAILAGRVLSVANSPFYGMAGKIGSLTDACRILGTHTIRNIITSAAVVGQFSADSLKNVDYTEVWRHSTAVAITAKVLAKQADIDPDEAFTTGLLHDIGKLVLDHFFSQHYEKVFLYQEDSNCLLIEAESQVLGVTHCDAGAAMASQWKLPSTIIAGIKGHHELDEHQTEKMASLIHFADVVSRALDEKDTVYTSIPILNDNAMKNLGISLALLEDNLEAIDRQICSSTSLFN